MIRVGRCKWSTKILSVPYFSTVGIRLCSRSWGQGANSRGRGRKRDDSATKRAMASARVLRPCKGPALRFRERLRKRKWGGVREQVDFRTKELLLQDGVKYRLQTSKSRK